MRTAATRSGNTLTPDQLEKVENHAKDEGLTVEKDQNGDTVIKKEEIPVTEAPKEEVEDLLDEANFCDCDNECDDCECDCDCDFDDECEFDDECDCEVYQWPGGAISPDSSKRRVCASSLMPTVLIAPAINIFGTSNIYTHSSYHTSI